ncbi:MAG TPA: PilT/PilU family type 4a pilus ATPase [Phycisphaerae bacterium]|nr:PilT/PilU family type 4a pilus ATPase [Phycisphaerales bacterium]HRX83998.1 PilT/PilU family type 4a pilus ATPase [Phycisphaerae bacterium]
MSNIQSILKLARQRRAADIHIVAGSPVLFRVKGELLPVTREVLDARMARELAYTMLTPEQIKHFEENLDHDFMLSDDDRNRYRVNIAFNDGAVGAVVRLLASVPMTLDEIRVPPIVRQLTNATKGLILITGATSEGKTTTMAAMIDEINRTQRKHIITIEDPIEYVHFNKMSVVRQREIGKDTKSFARGLRAALRQDPDMIAIGEMRDYETIKIALTAAETGVLVISTIHVISIDKIIERFLAYAPDGSDGHMRSLLSEALLGVIHQELLTTVDGGKRLAVEILVTTDAVRNVMRNRGTFHLRNVITTGQRYGMKSMKNSLDELLDEGVISESVYNRILENYA